MLANVELSNGNIFAQPAHLTHMWVTPLVAQPRAEPTHMTFHNMDIQVHDIQRIHDRRILQWIGHKDEQQY